MLISLRKIIVAGILLSAGFVSGGYLFSETQPRPIINLDKCAENCFDAKELAGLLGSVGIQRFGSVLPLVIEETEKSIAIKHPRPEAKIHYVILPKRDIKNIGEVGSENVEYVEDAYLVMSALIDRFNLINYRIVTNGPGYQSVAYLHFHLIGK